MYSAYTHACEKVQLDYVSRNTLSELSRFHLPCIYQRINMLALNVFKTTLTKTKPSARPLAYIINSPSSAFATLTNTPLKPSIPPSPPVAAAPAGGSNAETASVHLQSGHVFQGKSFGANASISGEVVFTTSLVGYPESMTDPSYRGQILVFTQPLVGNYGVPASTKDAFGLPKYFESNNIHVSGIIVSNYAEKFSHWNAVKSLGEWCKEHGVPAISGVDTREVVKILTSRGSTLGKIVSGGADTNKVPMVNPNERNLVDEVSTKSVQVYNKGSPYKIAVVDCGAKLNILRSLISRNAEIHVLPWNTPLAPISHEFDGIFLSNGPGDPSVLGTLSSNLRTLLQSSQTKNLPIFGICMGNLVLGKAIGLQSYKLKFGNRGHNQPCLDLTSGKCVITSQNHGYALQDAILDTNHSSNSMLHGWKKYFVNANDGSNEGIKHSVYPWRSVQFHPEAKGGPLDTDYLFDEFLKDVQIYKKVGVRRSTTVKLPIIDMPIPKPSTRIEVAV
ncbi:hypothetical protein BKA69DRAFT_1035690 [Paraphysoderma sedebokerense]|nr:hypothetical protein BKA69DRAFT_1035690 [Paraphysoderma sedebokerense]